jgi:hypothetical protein
MNISQAVDEEVKSGFAISDCEYSFSLVGVGDGKLNQVKNYKHQSGCPTIFGEAKFLLMNLFQI